MPDLWHLGVEGRAFSSSKMRAPFKLRAPFQLENELGNEGNFKLRAPFKSEAASVVDGEGALRTGRNSPGIGEVTARGARLVEMTNSGKPAGAAAGIACDGGDEVIGCGKGRGAKQDHTKGALTKKTENDIGGPKSENGARGQDPEAETPHALSPPPGAKEDTHEGQAYETSKQ